MDVNGRVLKKTMIIKNRDDFDEERGVRENPSDFDCFSYNGIVVDPNERDSLAKDLGPNNKVTRKIFAQHIQDSFDLKAPMSRLILNLNTIVV